MDDQIYLGDQLLYNQGFLKKYIAILKSNKEKKHIGLRI